ncbi:MAG: 50S ribosomal protein L4 [Candidatus Saccharimonadales bacterium]
MATAATYTKTGAKASKATTLPKQIFDVKADSHVLLKQAYDTSLSNQRSSTAHTKTRGNVRGGGKKPWRQKGTGRARAGSIRSPIWRGGGITFGPLKENSYKKKLNKSAKQLALKQALSLKAQSKQVSVIEAIEAKDGKTKSLSDLVNKLGLDRKVLIVVDHASEDLKRAASNIANVELVEARNLNTKSTIDSDNLLITKPALAILNERLGE